MQYTGLGCTRLSMSRLCLGTMTFGWSADEQTSFAIMGAALHAGINFFDTADIYSSWIEGNKGGESEAIIGRWLKQRSRREIVIATKVRGVPVAHIALAWLLAQAVITSPIIGARTVAQLTELVGAVDLALADDEITRPNEVSRSF